MGTPVLSPANIDSKQFSHDFPGFDPRPDWARPQGAPREQDWTKIDLEKQAIDLDRIMKLMNPVCGTVVNMNPFALKVNGVLHDDLIVPACPDDLPYIRYRISHYKAAYKDQGEAKYVVYGEPPLQLAYEFEREFFEQGGVFFYPGDFPLEGDVLDSKFIRPEGRLFSETTIRESMESAKKRQIAWCQKYFNEAQNEWNAQNGNRKIIGEWHRRAALVLLKYREIEEADKPVWMSLKREQTRMTVCPVCDNTVRKAAVLCTSCGFPFDPIKAYDLGMITPESTHLRRASDEDLLARGLDPAKYKPAYKKAKKAKAVETAPEVEATEPADEATGEDNGF
jgi:hypothetical protein